MTKNEIQFKMYGGRLSQAFTIWDDKFQDECICILSYVAFIVSSNEKQQEIKLN